MITYVQVSAALLADIKAQARGKSCFSTVKSSHLTEAIAAAFGFKTHAVALAAVQKSPDELHPFNFKHMSARLAKLGYKVAPNAIGGLYIPEYAQREVVEEGVDILAGPYLADQTISAPVQDLMSHIFDKALAEPSRQKFAFVTMIDDVVALTSDPLPRRNREGIAMLFVSNMLDKLRAQKSFQLTLEQDATLSFPLLEEYQVSVKDGDTLLLVVALSEFAHMLIHQGMAGVEAAWRQRFATLVGGHSYEQV